MISFCCECVKENLDNLGLLGHGQTTETKAQFQRLQDLDC